MQIKDLDGHLCNWQLIGGIAHGAAKNKSSLHLIARDLMHRCFPTMQILEEVPIPLRRSETLYLDFYIPLLKRAVEVHGEQHYKFTPFYHSTLLGFVKHKKRDQEKQEWCEINGISYIELPFNENEESWLDRIKNEQQNS
jgi:hypothetical protein